WIHCDNRSDLAMDPPAGDSTSLSGCPAQSFCPEDASSVALGPRAEAPVRTSLRGTHGRGLAPSGRLWRLGEQAAGGTDSDDDDHGNDHRLAAQLRGHPAADRAAHDLLQLVLVDGSVTERILDGLGHLRHDRVEDVIGFGDTAGVDLGAGDERLRLRVHGDEDRHEALSGQDQTVLEVGLGDLADRRPVDEDVVAVHGADDLGAAVLEVDDPAVIGQDDVLPIDSGRLGVAGIGQQVPPLTVDGHDAAGLDDVVRVQQLAAGGMAGDMDLRIGLRDHAGTELHQAVDDLEHGVLVAGDERGGEDDGVAVADLDAVVAIGHARQRCHRFALRARAHEDDLVLRVVVDLLDVDERALGHVKVAEVGGDLHVAHHRPADEGDVAAVGVGGVEQLLDAVDVGGEGSDDDAAFGGAEEVLEHGADVLLQGSEAGDLGVRRVRHEQVHALLAEAGEGAQVGDAAVERQLVHLEVAGVEDVPGTGADEDSQSIGDRVVDGDEFEVEGTELVEVVLGDHTGDGLDPVFLELGLDERDRQLRAEDRDVALAAQQIGHGTDVVLVAVGQDEPDDVVEAVIEVGEVGEDEVDAGLVLFGEEHAAVDDEQFAVVFEHGHIAPDLTEPAERDDANGLAIHL